MMTLPFPLSRYFVLLNEILLGYSLLLSVAFRHLLKCRQITRMYFISLGADPFQAICEYCHEIKATSFNYEFFFKQLYNFNGCCYFHGALNVFLLYPFQQLDTEMSLQSKEPHLKIIYNSRTKWLTWNCASSPLYRNLKQQDY